MLRLGLTKLATSNRAMFAITPPINIYISAATVRLRACWFPALGHPYDAPIPHRATSRAPLAVGRLGGCGWSAGRVLRRKLSNGFTMGFTERNRWYPV